jgi:hypothetical protein
MGLGAFKRARWGFDHPQLSRRAALQAGGIGIVGLGIQDLSALRAIAAEQSQASGPRSETRSSRTSAGRMDRDSATKAKSVIYIFLSSIEVSRFPV